MVDLKYGHIGVTKFSLARDNYLAATRQKDVDPKVFAFVAEQKDTADDWDKLITMAADTCVGIIIIDVSKIENNRIYPLIYLISGAGFHYDLECYEGRLCFARDPIEG